jgi:hypothetical protein
MPSPALTRVGGLSHSLRRLLNIQSVTRMAFVRRELKHCLIEELSPCHGNRPLLINRYEFNKLRMIRWNIKMNKSTFCTKLGLKFYI